MTDPQSTTTEIVDDTSEVVAEPAAEDARGGRVRRVLRWCRSRLSLILAAVLVVAAAAVAGGVYWWVYRPDQQTDAAVAKTALTAASEGTVALLSYSPESLDRDFATAKSHLTGDFLTYYSKFTDQIVAPAAKQKAVKTTATVVRAAVSELHPDKAVVLVFLNQTTSSSDKPEPAQTASSVLVTVTKTHNDWLISAFDPV